MSTPTGAGGEQPPEPTYDAQNRPSGPDAGAPAYPSGPDAGAQAYPPPPGYGPPPGYPAGPGYGPVQQPQNGLGITALVLGIVGLVLAFVPLINYVGGVLCIVAIILGVLGMQKANRGEATNRGVAVGGLVTGIIGLIVAIVIAILIAVGISWFNNNGGREAVQCIQQANGDRAQIEQCNDRFSDQLQRNTGG